jgi:Kef-type K+ transport system membrane component KefB
MAYVAEVYFGVADITGAYLAGLVISQTARKEYIEKRFSVLSYLMLSPIFFASIGIKVKLPSMTKDIIIFTVLIIVVATITKIIGCGIGAKCFKYSTKECIQIGAGMVSRGEVALVVMDKGGKALMPSSLQGSIVIMVVATTIVAPILLKLLFKDKA